MQIVVERIRPVEINAVATAAEPEAGQQARQPEHVIPMHMGDEDSAQLGQAQITAHELVLGAFTAVKQPQFGALRQTDRHC